jgi:hypothetical protein
MWRQFPLNLKKNPPHNYVEAVPAESQKESTPKLCNYVEAVPTESQKDSPQIYVEAVPAESQKESAPKF